MAWKPWGPIFFPHGGASFERRGVGSLSLRSGPSGMAAWPILGVLRGSQPDKDLPLSNTIGRDLPVFLRNPKRDSEGLPSTSKQGLWTSQNNWRQSWEMALIFWTAPLKAGVRQPKPSASCLNQPWVQVLSCAVHLIVGNRVVGTPDTAVPVVDCQRGVPFKWGGGIPFGGNSPPPE